MTYVVKFYALYWVAALIGGVLVGMLTWENRQRPGWFSGWTAWATILFLIGLVVALLKLVTGRGGHYLELALIFFAAYIIGCWLGALLRALFAPARGELQARDHAAMEGVALAAAGAGASAAPAAPTLTSPTLTSPTSTSPTATPSTAASFTTAPARQAGEEGSIVSPAQSAAPAAATAPQAARPVGLAGPRGGKADDLKQIRGIGRQNEEKLHGLGVFHFDQIAAWTKENIEWVGDFLAFHGRIEREDWVGQARELAAGRETEFSKRVASGEVPTSQED